MEFSARATGLRVTLEDQQMVRPSSPRLVPFVLAVLLTLVVGPAWGLAPELPRVLVDTTLIPPTGMTIPVFAGGNLQAALDAAHPGDVITLERGAMFAGPFTLPNKTGLGRLSPTAAHPNRTLCPHRASGAVQQTHQACRSAWAY